MRTICVAVSVFFFLVTTVRAQTPESWAYTTTTGVRWSVAADGTFSASAKGVQVLGGKLRTEPLTQLMAGSSITPSWKAGVRGDDGRIATQSRFVHSHTSHTVTYDFAADGASDLNVYVRVEYLSGGTAGIALGVLDAPGLSPVLGLQQAPSWFGANQDGSFYPSGNNPIGGSCGVGAFPVPGGFAGVGFSPVNDAQGRSAVWWNGSAVSLLVATKPEDYVRVRRFVWKLRVWSGADSKQGVDALLGRYVSDFQPRSARQWAKAGPIVMAFLNDARNLHTPDNPYSLLAGPRRIDTPEGAAAFCRWLVGPMKDVGAQGVILWGHTGQFASNMYRVDADNLPAPIAAGLKVINTETKAAGLRWGVLIRPGELLVAEGTGERIVDVNADDPTHVSVVVGQVGRLAALGADMFYCDSFGQKPGHLKIMQVLRQTYPGALFLTEFTTDKMLEFAGSYNESRVTAEGIVPGGVVGKLPTLRRLIKNPQVFTRSRVDGNPGARLLAEGFVKWALDNRCGVLVEDWTLVSNAATLKAAYAGRLDAYGQLK